MIGAGVTTLPPLGAVTVNTHEIVNGESCDWFDGINGCVVAENDPGPVSKGRSTKTAAPDGFCFGRALDG